MTGRVHRFTQGDRLRKAREEAGYDQRGFEAVSGISRATISAYELGKSTPKRTYLAIWANVTGTDLDWLTHGDTSETGDNLTSATNSAETDTGHAESGINSEPDEPTAGWGAGPV